MQAFLDDMVDQCITHTHTHTIVIHIVVYVYIYSYVCCVLILYLPGCRYKLRYKLLKIYMLQ